MIDTSLTSSNFYFLLAVMQGGILAGLIIFQRPRRKTHVYFGMLVFLFSLALLRSLLEESIHAFNGKFPVPMDFSFAYGPLAYLHILQIKDPLRPFSRKDLLHFLPTLIFDVLFFTSAFLNLRNHMDWADANIPLIQAIALGVAFIQLIQLSLYTYWIYQESRDSRPVLREYNQVSRWLSYLVISWTFIIGFLMIAIPIGLFFIEQLDEHSAWFYKPIGIMMALWIMIMGYLYLVKYRGVVGSYMDKVRAFAFSANELAQKKLQILDALTREELFKDPKLTVAKLAGHLGWPINSVSKIINEALETNFNDLINQHRVTAFKELATQSGSEKFTLLALSQEVGFSSKASFYRVFKQETGMTPTAFIKSRE